MKDPSISVLIPTYNRAETLVEAVESVLNQTYGRFELLVVDDRSEDDTTALVESWTDPRIRYLVNRRSKGAQGARNTGLHAARGEWVALLDSDDVWHPRKLECEVDFIRSGAGEPAGIATGALAYGSPWTIDTTIPPGDWTPVTVDEVLYRNIVGGFSVFTFRRDVGLEIGGFDERMPAMQDIDFYARIAVLGSLYKSEAALVKVRKSNDDRISVRYDLKLEAALRLHEKYQGRLARSPGLLNRSHNRIFLFSLLSGDYRSAVKHAPWFFRGVAVDFGNFLQITKKLAGHAYRSVTAMRISRRAGGARPAPRRDAGRGP